MASHKTSGHGEKVAQLFPRMGHKPVLVQLPSPHLSRHSGPRSVLPSHPLTGAYSTLSKPFPIHPLILFRRLKNRMLRLAHSILWCQVSVLVTYTCTHIKLDNKILQCWGSELRSSGFAASSFFYGVIFLDRLSLSIMAFNFLDTVHTTNLF